MAATAMLVTPMITIMPVVIVAVGRDRGTAGRSGCAAEYGPGAAADLIADGRSGRTAEAAADRGVERLVVQRQGRRGYGQRQQRRRCDTINIEIFHCRAPVRAEYEPRHVIEFANSRSLVD
ncbi:hypothetical protein [Salinisphaera orenii]|uniref:hypothetical protein n=1 Tax=Salinisphaera orenii TaxID=856731 RepID=UPI00161186C5|nr:hypothetical protein [Salinisphaera halophila]